MHQSAEYRSVTEELGEEVRLVAEIDDALVSTELDALARDAIARMRETIARLRLRRGGLKEGSFDA
ncbi:MAG: hypothetical protein JWP97_5410 [Labilithrix sp.]|nr:hypothetical protein [Labilithrix sp.]